MDDSKKDPIIGIQKSNFKLKNKFEEKIKINNLILLSDGRLCFTTDYYSNSSISIYDKYNYQIQSKIKLKSLIEDIVELSGGLIVKQKYIYELYIFRKKDFKLIQLINHQFNVESIFELNKKLIICTKYGSNLEIEIWEKDKNNLYILTGFLINNLISSFCLINEEKIKSNVFFCDNPLSKGLKDNQQIMQAKNKMDQEYSKIRDQRQKLIQEREELKKKIRVLNEQIYKLGGKEEEIINPMMPNSMQPTFMDGQRLQHQYYYDQFNPMLPLPMNPQIYQGMGYPFYHDQFNPLAKAQKIQIYSVFDGELIWTESTKFSTNLLTNYSKNSISSIDLDKNYLNIKVITIKANENKLVSAFIYKYSYPKKISIKICDLKNHIGNIMVIELRRDLNFIDSIIDIDGNYILFGIWLIDINSCQIIFKFNIFERIYIDAQYFKKYFKLLNGNILIFSIDKNFSGEYKFENNQLVKIGENIIEDSDIIIENKDKEIITYSNNLLKIWEKIN